MRSEIRISELGRAEDRHARNGHRRATARRDQGARHEADRARLRGRRFPGLLGVNCAALCARRADAALANRQGDRIPTVFAYPMLLSELIRSEPARALSAVIAGRHRSLPPCVYSPRHAPPWQRVAYRESPLPSGRVAAAGTQSAAALSTVQFFGLLAGSSFFPSALLQAELSALTSMALQNWDHGASTHRGPSTHRPDSEPRRAPIGRIERASRLTEGALSLPA